MVAKIKLTVGDKTYEPGENIADETAQNQEADNAKKEKAGKETGSSK